MSDIEDESSSEVETDSDAEYEVDTDTLKKCKGPVTAAAFRETYVKQRGLCRISGMPLSDEDGMYKPTVVPRILSREISDANHMIVASVIQKLHAGSGLKWRPFVRLLNLLGKEAEL